MNVDAVHAGRAMVAPTWFGRLKIWWDHRLADPAFQRWVSRFPPTRRLARRHANALFDLCAGFVYSQVLLACVRLRLLEQLRDGPLALPELSRRLELAAAPTLHLLEAARALGLLETRGTGLWGLGTIGAALLGNPAVQRMIEHHALLYDDLRDPVALLRGGASAGQLAGMWPYARNQQPAGLGPAQVSAYTALMAATQPLVAEELLDAYPIARHRCLLDVGGGNGTFLLAAAARAPRLQLMLFDLPAVATEAQARLEAAGLGARARTFGGDFAVTPLPTGADLITLVRVLHDHDDDCALALLRAARLALAPGGRLLIAEPMAGVAGSLPGTEAYFALYLLAMGQGRARHGADIFALLQAAGFVQPRVLKTLRPWQCALISATAGMEV